MAPAAYATTPAAARYWNSATIYFLLTDRFANGDPSNDGALGRKKDGARLRNFEGGDLKGLTEKVNAGYFDSLGVDAIWLTPFVEQVHGAVDEGTGKTYGYHGYWARDWTAVDPALGTRDDLRAFVAAAHAHKIRVLMDAVINHLAPSPPRIPRGARHGCAPRRSAPTRTTPPPPTAPWCPRCPTSAPRATRPWSCRRCWWPSGRPRDGWRRSRPRWTRSSGGPVTRGRRATTSSSGSPTGCGSSASTATASTPPSTSRRRWPSSCGTRRTAPSPTGRRPTPRRCSTACPSTWWGRSTATGSAPGGRTTSATGRWTTSRTATTR
ncbi:MAG: hypothetical protein IPK12_19950 [Gemmatimonadetes bacterium]|nr:hypothetical protein [Gemmatimonadota bacterium]